MSELETLIQEYCLAVEARVLCTYSGRTQRQEEEWAKRKEIIDHVAAIAKARGT